MLRSAEEQERLFREWMRLQKNAYNEPFKDSTINAYSTTMKRAHKKYNSDESIVSIFDIQDVETFNKYVVDIVKHESFEEFDKKSGNCSCSNGYKQYKKFLQQEGVNRSPIKFQHNRIIFGAPGTGKSYKLNNEKEVFEEFGDYERVTFHPDYSYANFVGVYKPIPCKTATGEDAITYGYVPGPFMRTFIKAVKEPKKPFLLIIEEINRANMAAVFGDIFQLLDRKPSGDSMYPIQTSEDVRQYLKEQLGNDVHEMIIPKNMYIWATMNSADQGVYPMDTAFKRRWNFEYLDIDDGEDILPKDVLIVGNSEKQSIVWNDLRKAINEQLISYNINEDKLLGPFFVPYDALKNKETFSNVFKYKVLMYLFEDAARQKRRDLFTGCNHNIFSKICKAFDEKGVRIFCDGISSKFTDVDEPEAED